MAFSSPGSAPALQLVAVRPGRRRFALIEGHEDLDRLVMTVHEAGPSCHPHSVEVVVTGEVDFGSAPRLEAVLAPLVTEVELVRVRLEQVTFFDAAGAGVLVKAARVCRARGARFALRAPSRSVQRVLGITGLHRILNIE